MEYELGLKLDPDSETLSGSVEIAVQVFSPTEVIWLNARDLEIQLGG